MIPTKYTIPGNQTEKEFGKINIQEDAQKLNVELTILMDPSDEGWQTGVALDASASMMAWFGRKVKHHKIPWHVMQLYKLKGWVKTEHKDDRNFEKLGAEAHEDAIKKEYIQLTDNIVEPLAREFIAYLADGIDADGQATVIYWACDKGSTVEVLGDLTGDQCRTLAISGPEKASFGAKTMLKPAVKYFADRFIQAKRGIYIFITDGKIDDLYDVLAYSTQLAKEIAAGKRNMIKCVLIGVGSEVDETQMIELDNLDSGTDIDIWDHKIAKEMRALLDIFSEVVDENKIVAPTAVIYDNTGNKIKAFTDGLPAKITFSLPLTCQWFELEVAGRRIRQKIVKPIK